MGARLFRTPEWDIKWVDVVYMTVMAIGILAKEVWDNINESGAPGVRSPRLIAAFLVLPIAYAGGYSLFVKDRLSVLGLAVAFQNGFFWQAFFRNAQGGK